jgi:hypothetical protein
MQMTRMTMQWNNGLTHNHHQTYRDVTSMKYIVDARRRQGACDGKLFIGAVEKMSPTSPASIANRQSIESIQTYHNDYYSVQKKRCIELLHAARHVHKILSRP